MTSNEMPDEIWVDGVPDDLIGILGEYSVHKHDNGCTRYIRADLAPPCGAEVREAVERVNEFVRQRCLGSDGKNDTIYIVHADVGAKEARLRQSDLQTLIRAAQYEETAVREASRLNDRCLMLERQIAASTPACKCTKCKPFSDLQQLPPRE